MAERRFRAFLIGTTFANVAQWMQIFALGWLAVEVAIRDGQPERGALYIGFQGLVRLPPALVFGSAGAVVADRFDRRMVLLATRTAMALVMVAAAGLTLTGTMTIALLLVITFLAQATMAMDTPARLTIPPVLVRTEHVLGALGVTRMVQMASSLAGPLLAGLLVLPFGVGGVLVVATLFYALSGAGLGQIPALPPAQHAMGHPFAAFGEAFAYARREPALRAFLIAQLVLNIAGGAVTQLLPAVAHDTLVAGAVEASWLVSAYALGVLIASIVVTSMHRWRDLGATLVAFTALTAGLLIAFGLQREVLPALVLMGLFGCAMWIYIGAVENVIQMTVPNEIRGRVLGLWILVWGVGMPVGTLVLGALGSWIGISNAIVAGGGVVCLVALALWRSSSVRNVEIARGVVAR